MLLLFRAARTTLILCLLALTATADPAPAEDPAGPASPEDVLMRGEPWETWLAARALVAADMAREQRLMKAAEAILLDPGRTQRDEARLRGLLYALRVAGNGQSASILARHLDFRYAHVHPIPGKQVPPIGEYPCLAALASQGEYGLSSLARVIAGTDDPKRAALARLGLENIGFGANNFETQHDMPNKGRRFARAFLRSIVETITDAETKARLERSVRVYDEQIKANAPPYSGVPGEGQ